MVMTKKGRRGWQTNYRATLAKCIRELQEGKTMTRLSVLAISALLFLPTAAHAQSWQPKNAGPEKWEGNFRQCHIRKRFSKDELAEIGWQREAPGQTIVIEENEIGDLEKAIRLIKQCKAFYKCLADRDAGKVKHCYENDRRWRLNQ